MQLYNEKHLDPNILYQFAMFKKTEFNKLI